MLYRMVYIRNDYTLADAFRPNPFWGKKAFSAKLDYEADDAELTKAAHDTAPDGYRLQCLEAIGGDPHVRTIYPPEPAQHDKGDV